MTHLLVKALKNSFEMAKEDAVELAKKVEEIFEGREELEDMSIDKYTRALFYELQRKKLLMQRREEIRENGKIIRKYYWSFDDGSIKDAAYRKTKKDPYKIYKIIPEDAWIKREYCS